MISIFQHSNIPAALNDTLLTSLVVLHCRKLKSCPPPQWRLRCYSSPIQVRSLTSENQEANALHLLAWTLNLHAVHQNGNQNRTENPATSIDSCPDLVVS